MYHYALHLAPILLGPWLALATQQSFLSDTLIRKAQVQSVLTHQPTTDVACRHASVRCRLVVHIQLLTSLQQPKGPIETTLCDYESVESVNEELYRNLAELVRLPFFKYFRVRL